MLIIIGLMLVFVIFSTQNRTYINNPSCEKLRESILLDYVILEEHIENGIFFLEWEFDSKVLKWKQKEYYLERCLE